MSATTHISWCDATFNPWIGCTKVGPGCDHCYAEAEWDKRRHRAKWGAGNPRSRTAPSNWLNPKKWNDKPFCECQTCGYRGDDFDAKCPACHTWTFVKARRRVFSSSLADWLDNEVPIEWLVDFLDLVRRTPNLDWLLLTKRIGRFVAALDAAIRYVNVQQTSAELFGCLRAWRSGNPPANVWIGATVVNQAEADRDVPKLLAVPARIRFLSIEPMLGPIRLDVIDIDGHREIYPLTGTAGCEDSSGRALADLPRINWVIPGFESGPRARPGNTDWLRALRDQCAAAGTAFHFKQHGEWVDASNPAFGTHSGEVRYIRSDGSFWERPPMDENADCRSVVRVGKKAAGRLLDGVEHNGFPAVLS